MERKFLKDLGLSEDAVEQIMAENGKDIAAQKERLSAESQRALELENRLSAEKEELLRQLHGQELDAAVAMELSKEGARNLKAARALLNLENAEFSEDGSIAGLMEQILSLKSAPETGFLFEKPEAPRGFLPGEGRDGLPGGGVPLSLGEAVRTALLEAEP